MIILFSYIELTLNKYLERHRNDGSNDNSNFVLE